MKAHSYTIRVHRAQDLGDQLVQPVTIIIGAALPESTGQNSPIMHDDARQIFDALKGSLPGGTLTELVALLLRDLADRCKLRVVMPRKKAPFVTEGRAPKKGGP